LGTSGGGFPGVSIETLGGRQAAERATKQPTMFESKNCEAFKQHTFKVSFACQGPQTKVATMM
jgi:hypothetical protein